MSKLCRLGLHSWHRRVIPVTDDELELAAGMPIPCTYGDKWCPRCGKERA